MSPGGEVALHPASVAELCRDRWHAMAGSIPDDASAMIERGEHFFSVLLLLETLTAGRLVKWRVTFSSAGGACEYRFWVRKRTNLVREFCGQDASSLTLSLIAALDRFRTADGDE
jgi:hypothetical protein